MSPAAARQPAHPREAPFVPKKPRARASPLQGTLEEHPARRVGSPSRLCDGPQPGKKTQCPSASIRLLQEPTAQNPGFGTCYVQFGANQIGRVDVDFFGGPKPTGTFHTPSEEMRGDKRDFGATRRARWFGRASGST